ncbi:MAG: hypothetical protein GY795_27150 [Desulfobacterales bacterium]|nr:hypothetical protein [Desulfobacterales bacterium]
MMRAVCIVLLVLISSTTQATEIASLSFKKIEPVLKDIIFTKTEYEKLKEMSRKAADFDPVAFTKTDDNGNIVIEKKHIQHISNMTSKFEADKLVKDAMRRELILVIESMDLKHAIVLNGDEFNALFYSKVEIEDITQKVYQELIKRLSNRKPNQNTDTKNK